MRPRVAVTVGIVLVVGLFCAANWSTLVAPANLNLLVAQIQAPLGVVLVLMLAAVMLVYLALLGVVEGQYILAQRRMARDMDRLRKLAEQSEASRYADLRAYVESQFLAIGDKLDRLAQQQAGTPSAARTPAPPALPERPAPWLSPSRGEQWKP